MPANVQVTQVNNINISKDLIRRGDTSFDITLNKNKTNIVDFQNIMNDSDDDIIKMPNISQKGVLAPKLPKGMYRQQTRINRQSMNNSAVVTQDPKIKAKLISKANRSHNSSPSQKNDIVKMQEKDKYGNVTAIKQKINKSLLSNHSRSKSKENENRRHLANSQHSAYKPNSKITINNNKND